MRKLLIACSLFAASTALADNHSTDFDQLDIVAAQEFLPTDLQSGPNHTISSEATADGFQNTYTLNSKYGAFEATGLSSVKQRINEIDALAYLEAASRADVFVSALTDAGVETAGAIAQVFTSPVKTVQGIPGGIDRVFDGAKRGFGLTKRLFQRKSNEEGIDPEDFREQNYLLGNSQRKWASELKTDPYTTNMKLRETISRMSVVEFIGGLPIDIALPMGAGLAVGVLGDETEVYRQSAAQLETTNRACLKQLGAKGNDIDNIINANYLTPTRQTAVCKVLSKLEGIEGSLALGTAIAASESFEASDFLLQTGRLMAWYADLANADSANNTPAITSIMVVDGLPYAMTGDTALLLLAAENLQWTKSFADRINNLADHKGAVWVLGSPSATTSMSLEKMGWQVVTTRSNADLHELYHAGL